MFTEAVEFLKEYGDVLGAIGTLSAFTMIVITNGRVIMQRLRGQKPVSLQNQIFGGKTAVAVLPIQMQGETDAERTDTLTIALEDDLHTDLQAAGFSAPAPDITRQAISEGKSNTTLAKQLGANYALETNIRSANDTCKLTARLTSSLGAVVWSKRFETSFEKLTTDPEAMAEKIIAGINECISEPASNQDVAVQEYSPSPAQTAVGLPSVAPNIALSGLELPAQVSPKSRFIAFMLCFFVVGLFGAHRFYVGRPFTGTLYIFTAGLLTFGWLFDLILICLGMFADGKGRPVKNFQPQRTGALA